MTDPGPGPSGPAGFHGAGRTEVVDPDELVSVDAYRAFISERLPRLEPIELRVSDTLGLVLGEDVRAEEPIPSFANSAMDGYAVIAADVATASAEEPATIRVVGEVAAGAADPPAITSGTTVRIMTGAPLPPGADAVVPVEVTSEQDRVVAVHRPAGRGDHVRRVGEDVRPGQGLLRAGHRIRPADIGLLAAVGARRLRAIPAPRVVILSTGDELVAAERRPGPGRIRDANGPMLAALVRSAGGVPFSAGIVRDDRKALMYAFDSNLGHADVFVATGGVSAGVYDLVRDVIGSLGEVHAFKVAMKPGMPQVFGRVGGVPVFGLPGNPVSSFVSFEVFVRPALRELQGRRDVQRPTVVASAAEELSSPPHKRSFLRVRLHRGDDGWTATSSGHQGSHVLTSLVRADGLAEVDEETTVVRAGDPVSVHLLTD